MRFVSAYNSYSRAPRGILAYIVVDIPYMYHLDDAFKVCFEVSHKFSQFDMYIYIYIHIDGYSILQYTSRSVHRIHYF